MKDFKLDENGDVILSHGDIRLVTDGELLCQKIRQVLSTNRGEWWLNPGEGVPVQKILVKNPDQNRIRDYIKRALRQVDGGLELTKCRIERQGRTMVVCFAVSGKGKKMESEIRI